jgi:hypothetical protein
LHDERSPTVKLPIGLLVLQRTIAGLTEEIRFGIDSLVSVGKELARRSDSPMPGDPKECRQHALNCVRLAQTAATPEHFANLARTWIRLADEIESTDAFLTALDDEIEPIKRAG